MGVVLQAGSRRATTDQSGAFTLKALPAGDVEIRISATDLPAGWRLFENPRFHLEDGPGVAQDAEILLQPGEPAH